MATALNFPQYALTDKDIRSGFRQGIIPLQDLEFFQTKALRNKPIQQQFLAERLMGSMKPQDAQMALMRANTNMMPPGQFHRLDPRNQSMNITPLGNTNAGQTQSMAQPGASGSGPSFRFQDLNKAYQLDPRNTLANTLMQQGMRGGPVRTIGEGIGRLSQSLVGAMLQKKSLDRLEGQEATRIEEQNIQKANLANALNEQLGNLPENSPIIPIIQTIQAASGPTEALNTLASIQAKQLGQTPPPIFKDVLDVDGNIIGQAGFNANDEQVTALDKYDTPELSQLAKNAILGGLEQGTPEFQKYILDNAAKSGQTISINTGVGDEKGYASILARSTSENEKAISGVSNAAKVDLMIDYLSDGTVQTGFGAKNVNVIRKLGQFFNEDFATDIVAGTDAFEAFTNDIILPVVSQLGRNPTDLDLAFVVAARPNLSKSVEGNLFLLEVMKVKQVRDVALANHLDNFILQELQKQTPANQLAIMLNQEVRKFVTTDPLFTNSYNDLSQKFKNITKKEPPKQDVNSVLNKFKKNQ